MCVFTGNIAAAVLQQAEMTITRELNNRESTHTDAYVGTEKEERQREKMPKETVEVEAAGEANHGEDGQKEDKEKEEKKDSLPEESLRMTSWVEVENERPSAQDNGEEKTSGKEGVGEVRDVVEEQVLLGVEGRSLGEAEKEQTRSVEEELAMMEEKWREQCAINETLKQRLADEEERFRVRRTLTRSGWKYEGSMLSQWSAEAYKQGSHCSVQQNTSFVNMG